MHETKKRHHLAPISGSIEHGQDQSSLDTAWRELREETGLTPSDLRLWRCGKPFSFADESVGREWTVYPFAFRMRSSDRTRIRIDWEHEGYVWLDAAEVLRGEGCVPRLRDSFSRVYFEGGGEMSVPAGRRLAEGLEELARDRESGARQLAGIALGIFRDVLSRLSSSGDDGAWWSRVRMVAWHLWKNGRESMGASVVNALVAVLVDLEAVVVSQTDGSAKDRVLGVIDAHIQRRAGTTARLCDAFGAYARTIVQDRADKTLRLLTLSASSTIRECVLHVAAAAGGGLEGIDLRILESRPLYEGVSMASALLLSDLPSSGDNPPRVKITIYTDASAALSATEVDMVLLGADRISADGAVSNKTGSLPAVLSARHACPSSKTVVLSELDKVAEPGNAREHVVEENDPAEVTRAWKEGGVKGVDVITDALQCEEKRRATIEVQNVYFEWVSPDLIDAYICEEGIRGVSDIQQRSTWVGSRIEHFFDGL